MNLKISFQNKDAAKAAFRAAGIPLTWNAAAKVWQTSASELPAGLAQYVKPAANGTLFYLAQRTDTAGFNFAVEAVFESKEAVIEHILSGRWLAGWAGDEAAIFAGAAYVVAATKRIAVGKSIPNQYVTGNNRLCESKNAEIKAAVLAAMEE